MGVRSADCGVYASDASIEWSGIGAEGGAFEGDAIVTVRYIEPAADGVDCDGDVLVITIETAAVEERRDPDTDEIIERRQPGAGTIEVEPKG
ncbi:MAG: hypothetical protein C4547_14215 [Phycisphaerales bacterium]|nr:MAG: hypothetical protein C4547_14215 [Phycisphaerales bacterium]